MQRKKYQKFSPPTLSGKGRVETKEISSSNTPYPFLSSGVGLIGLPKGKNHFFPKSAQIMVPLQKRQKKNLTRNPWGVGGVQPFQSKTRKIILFFNDPPPLFVKYLPLTKYV